MLTLLSRVSEFSKIIVMFTEQLDVGLVTEHYHSFLLFTPNR